MQLSVSCSTRITSQAITSKDILGTRETPCVEASARQWLTENEGEIKTKQVLKSVIQRHCRQTSFTLGKEGLRARHLKTVHNGVSL